MPARPPFLYRPRTVGVYPSRDPYPLGRGDPRRHRRRRRRFGCTFDRRCDSTREIRVEGRVKREAEPRSRPRRPLSMPVDILRRTSAA